MRVVVLPSDMSACGFYRMQLPAGAVQQIRPDWKIELYRPGDVQLKGDPIHGLQAIKGIPDPLGIDLLVVQRVGTRMTYQFVEWATQHGIATVMDSDDAMWAIDRDNTAYSSWNTEACHWRWMDRTAEVVDLVTVTTKGLEKRYARKHGRAEVLPNCIPGEVENVVSERDKYDPTLTIGWAGFTGTHPHDLQVVGDALQRITRGYDVKVRVVGDAAGAAAAWGIHPVDEVKPRPKGMPYYHALTSIDIALVPLDPTTFNASKSYLKALEFSSVGVPVVASPTPANRSLAATVPIHLAATPEDWYRQTVGLLESKGYRDDIRGEAYRAVQKHHTYEANAAVWAEAWERAMARQARIKAQ